jgi:spermidine synthase
VNFFRENTFPHHSQMFSMDTVLHQAHTGLQDALVFHNRMFGRVLVLDGVVQLTELDNHIYHETIAHVPLVLHGSARRVLIIGGGDGGTLKEALKHPINEVDLVEIDRGVIDLSRQFFPGVSDDAFQDPRVSIVVEDGVTFVSECRANYDVILIDSTDPGGPGDRLFSKEFYDNCRNLLVSTGILVVQSGTAPHQPEQLIRVCKLLNSAFGAARPFVAPVPSYPGGMLALVAASWSDSALTKGIDTLQRRFQHLRGRTKFYTPDIHRAAFALARGLSPPRGSTNTTTRAPGVDNDALRPALWENRT